MSRVDDNPTCNICAGNFDIESEGGVEGFIGVLSFALCPMCYSGLMDMYDQIEGGVDDEDTIN
tara:strand:+ start:1561 stop:1749 length:189 start_codon:yes stop_codon:yes gene_type:complete